MYVIDSNVFITAKNAHYAMDFCPGFWNWLEEAHVAGIAYSIEAVREELKVGNDELASWIKALPPSFFRAVDQAALDQLKKLSAWVNSQPQYSSAAVATFLDSADYFLVGQAKALNLRLSLTSGRRPTPGIGCGFRRHVPD